MLGSSAFRMSVTPGGALAGPWVKNSLWSTARAVPSFDLPFADTKSLVDAVTGQSLVTFTRASSGTSVGSDGLIKTATTNLLLRSEEFDNASWVKTGLLAFGSGSTANAIAAPNGSTAADLLTEDTSTGQHRAYQTVSNTVNANAYTLSVYVKAKERTRFYVGIVESPGFSRQGNAIFNLSNGTVVSASAGLNGATGGVASIQDVGNGWYRCSYALVLGGTNTAIFCDLNIVSAGSTISYTGDGISGIYLWGAQLEQSSTVGEYIPTTSTINSAPRFDHAITSSVTNLLLRSEEFDNAYWTKNNSCTITQNDTTAPNGTLTADRFNGAALSFTGVYVFPTTISGLVYTFSVYVKNLSGATSLRLGIESNPVNAFVTFNAATGVISSQGANVTSSSVQATGDGWYRVAVTYTATGSSVGVVIYSTSGLVATWYTWGAQLEQSSTVGEYVQTTSAPATANKTESLGLLVEEQRTNLLLRSEEFDNASWTKQSSVSVSANTDIAPNGTQTADTVTADQTLGVFQGVTSVVGLNYANSVYIKAGTATSMMLRDDTGAGRHIVFNPSTGAITSTAGTLVSSGSQAVGNGWYRYWIVYAADATTVRGIIRPNSSGSAQTFFVWGAQIEAGAFPTSYIPTTTAAATRSADVASITGSNFGTTRTNLLVRSEELDNASWVKLNNVTVTANATTAPNGFITADKIVEPASSADKPIVQSVTLIANTTYTASVYFKAAERPTILFHVRKSDYSTRFGGFFNTSTNVFTTETSGGGVLDSFTFTNVGGNWYRCSITGNIGANTAGIVTVYLANSSNNLAYAGDGTSGLFLWGAQLEVGAAVTPYIQSPSVFVSRASSGTYTGGNGVLQTATTNLLLRSEEFNDAYWTKTNSTVTANATTAPNGTLTAEKLITNSGASSGRVSVSITATADTPATLSCYAKQGETNIFGLFISDGITGRAADFNLTTGTVSGTPTAGMTASIQSVGDGWYRCVVTVAGASLSGTTRSLRIVQTVVAADGTSGLFIWGAQFEQSTTVGEYIPTTSTINSAARYDHDPISLIGKGLLLEEQRTNLLVRSEEFDNASWTKITATVTSNVATAPSGTVTADKLIVDNGQSAGYASQTISFVSGTSYTASCYAKAGEVSDFRFVFESGAFGSNLNAIFNLNTGVVSSFTAASASIQSAGNGWYRCVATALATATASAGVQFRSVHAGNGTNGILLWGAQLEAGAFPTSYIPTTTATVTRAADVSTSVATSVFESSWYSQSEGTVFASAQRLTNANDFNRLLSFNTGLSNDVWSIYSNANKYDGYKKVGSGADNFLGGANVGTLLNNHRVVAATNGSGLIMATDGVLSNEAAYTGMPTVNRLAIGSEYYPAPYNGTIRRLCYWGQRLPNSTIQAITQ